MTTLGFELRVCVDCGFAANTWVDPRCSRCDSGKAPRRVRVVEVDPPSGSVVAHPDRLARLVGQRVASVRPPARDDLVAVVEFGDGGRLLLSGWMLVSPESEPKVPEQFPEGSGPAGY